MPRKFENVFIGRESRKSKYTKWSERAVVVGYNSENQSYDIVVTTERLVGANKRTLNKTIRRVKALFPVDVDSYLPGEAVIVGYISDKREHPVILGVGDNVIQTPVKVTLGPTLDVEGNTSTDLTDEDDLFLNFPLSLFDSITGSTTTLTVDCDEPANDFFTHVAQTSGGQGAITFSVTALVGCTVTTNVVGRSLQLKRPDNSAGGGDAVAWLQIGTELICVNNAGGVNCLNELGDCATGPDKCCADGSAFAKGPVAALCRRCDGTVRTVCGGDLGYTPAQGGCGGVPRSTHCGPCDSSVLGTCGTCGPFYVRTDGQGVCADVADFDIRGGCSVPPATLGDCVETDNWGNMLIYFTNNDQAGAICDVRGPGLTNTLGLCCPCQLMEGLIVTATDSTGVNASLEVDLVEESTT